MKISIFGLGYVGAVTAGCLSKRGHSIVGVDVHPQKVDAFNEGIAPIVEPGVDELLRKASQQALLKATSNSEDAVRQTDLSIICVGTPSTLSGALDLSYVRGVVEEIAKILRASRKSHSIVLRSTMLPGSTSTLADE